MEQLFRIRILFHKKEHVNRALMASKCHDYN